MGRTPTGPEIARHFGFSDASSSYQHLRLLAQKGYLEIRRSGRKTPLAVRLTDLARNLLQISYPLLGSVPAGPLEEVMTNADKGIRTIEDLIPELKPGDYFLTVEGDSMIDAGLQPGDLVILRSGSTPNSGDICAVWVEGQGSTLKRVVTEADGTITLQPANPRYQPRTYSCEMVRIQGVLVASLSIKYPGR
jgi:repressor LexA